MAIFHVFLQLIGMTTCEIKKIKLHSIRRTLFVFETSIVAKTFNFICLFFHVPDVTLDIDTLTNEQKVLLNQCAQTYGMKDEDFVW